MVVIYTGSNITKKMFIKLLEFSFSVFFVVFENWEKHNLTLYFWILSSNIGDTVST